MSIRIATLVLDHYPTTDPCEQLVALVLADYADDDGGEVFPSNATLVRRTRLSERKVRYVLRSMQASGWLIQTKRANGAPGVTNHYRINPAWLKAAHEAHTGARRAGVGRWHLVPFEGGTGCPQTTKGTVRNMVVFAGASDRSENCENAKQARQGDGADPPGCGQRQDPAALPEGAPAGLTADDWASFAAYRRQIGRPLTPEGEKRTLRDLAALAAAGNDLAAVIDQSIRNGWRGLFPVKAHQPYAPNPHHGLSARQRARMETANELKRFHDLVARAPHATFSDLDAIDV